MLFTHQSARISLTAAQILSLNSAPVELLAGTAGSIIIVYSLYIRLFHGTTPFNPQATDFLVYYLGNTNNTTLTNFQTKATGFVDQTQDMSSWQSPYMGEGGGADLTADIKGSGLWLTQCTDNSFPSGANWTQGNGTMLVLIEYAIVAP